jgi:hypothetical protein
MLLQKRSVDAAAPKDKRYTLWDSDLGGFGVRVEVSGVKSGPAPVLFRSGAQVMRPIVRRRGVISIRGLSAFGAGCRSH